MSSRGFIETLGLVGAIEAADAMTKSANVQLQKTNFVGCGIVTLTVTGDLASVQSAVHAGCAAVQRIGGVLLASNVIGRPEYDIDVFTAPKKNCCVPNKKKTSCCTPESTEQSIQKKTPAPKK